MQLSGFKYAQAFLSGRPKHNESDAFSRRHPSMDPGQRAKIFAPFDALRGFSDIVASKEVMYEPFREIDDGRLDALNRRIAFLQPLVRDSKEARKNQVRIEVTYFSPCDDPDSENYEILGRYRTCEGILKKIDLIHWQLLLDDQLIDLDDVYDIRDPEGRFFRETDGGDNLENEF